VGGGGSSGKYCRRFEGNMKEGKSVEDFQGGGATSADANGGIVFAKIRERRIRKVSGGGNFEGNVAKGWASGGGGY